MVIFGLTVFCLLAEYFSQTVSTFSAYWFRPSDPDLLNTEQILCLRYESLDDADTFNEIDS